jgi:hypothetical protein
MDSDGAKRAKRSRADAHGRAMNPATSATAGSKNPGNHIIRRGKRERGTVDRFVPGSVTRFHITPDNEWNWLVKKMNVCVRNTMAWRRSEPLPVATSPGCWLLACKCDTAVEIAQHRHALAANGWKLLTCEPHIVSRIGNKANLHAYAKENGLLAYLPRHYESPEKASYPCMLKAAAGEHGKDIFIVFSAQEVREHAAGGFPGVTTSTGGRRWLLQEMCPGSTEHATTLLVKDGAILDAICTNYEYDREVYVWPFVEEYHEKRKSHEDIPLAHMDTMRRFVDGFSGVCNFNYKVRPSGDMCIFEVNARVGADIACDVPRRRAAAFFRKLDSLTPSLPPSSKPMS